MQRVNDVGCQATVKKKPEDVVAVMSSGLKPYFYFVSRESAGPDTLQQGLEAVSVVRDCEYARQHLAFRAEDKAIVLVFRNIDSNANHNDTSKR